MTATVNYAQISASLRELHSRLKHLQSRMLQETGISLTEFHILLLLNERKSACQNELAEAMNVDKALISRQIQAMEAKGLIQCCTDPECRRRKQLTLGTQANELLPRLQEVHRHSFEQLFASVEEQQLVALQNILKGLIETL